MLCALHQRCTGEAMGTASVSINRVSVGLAPPIYNALYHEARRLQIRMPELMRHIFLGWMERQPNGVPERKDIQP